MTKKTNQRNIIIGILIVVAILLFTPLSPFSLIQFQEGFLPYGESTNQITDLTFIGKQNERIQGNRITIFELVYDSKYWKIIQSDEPDPGFNTFLTSRNQQLFSGSDLEFIASIPQGQGSDGQNPVSHTILTSKEDFSERDFKANFISRPDGTLGGTHAWSGATAIKISLVGNSGKVGVISHQFERVPTPSDLNIIINPSVISDKINIFVNGIKTKEIFYSGMYDIEIVMDTACGSVRQLQGACGTKLTMKNPSFKQQFGCTKEPGEQFYVNIFNEGDIVNINKLDNFKKFCLDEAPLKIFSNIGSATNTEVLGDLVNGEQHIVPQGQVWSIEYIGDLKLFATECEADELFNDNENVCMARTVVSLQCAEGSEFDFDRGICVVETIPSEFSTSSIETHQDLQTSGKFRFTHILSDSQQKTPTSIKIGQSTFSSDGLSYNGLEPGNVLYPKDEFNWDVSFSFDGKSFGGQLNDEIVLNKFLIVKITDIGGFRDDDTLTVEDFKVEYTFDFNINFIELSYSDGKIIVTNNYQPIDGGIVITKLDNLGTTTIEEIKRTFIVGENVFSIDTTNLLEIKARPFIVIETPEFEYGFDSVEGISVKNLEVEGVTPIIEPIVDKPSNIKLILSVIGVLASVVVLIFLFRRVRR